MDARAAGAVGGNGSFLITNHAGTATIGNLGWIKLLLQLQAALRSV